MKIICRTLFDCSYTGVTGHFRISEIPFVDRAGQTVSSQDAWHRSRNQQRNWETMMQIIGLRTQPQNVSRPVHNNGTWTFEFVAESEGVYSLTDHPDPIAGLKLDCDGVPMVLGLDEQDSVAPTINTSGPEQNIWFDTINTVLD